MTNILPSADAETVSFEPRSTEPYRDREALAGVIEEGRIALGAPLADETINPNPLADDAHQAEAIKQLDPIVQEQLSEDRLPDEIVAEGQALQAEDEMNEAVGTEINRRGRVLGTFERNQQNFAAEVPDYFDTIYHPDLPVTPALADAVRNVPDGPRLIYALAADPARLDEVNEAAAAGNAGAALNVVRRDLGLPSRSNVSSAPSPVPTISGRGAAVQRSPDKMSQSEYNAGRRSGKIK